jgi:hypothetical protein
MKRVYLDQWAWIRLARAAAGQPEEEADVDALAVARFAAENGLASFPLSPTHYMELTAGASPRQRQVLAGTITQLSKFHTMRNPGSEVTAWELDMYLKRRFGRPVEPRSVQVFGQGLGHAFGNSPLVPKLVPKPGAPPATIDPGKKFYIEQIAASLAEMAMLTGPAPGVVVPGYQTRAHTIYDQKFVDEENAFAGNLRVMPRSRWASMQYARSLSRDVVPELAETLQHAALPASVLPDTRDGWMELLQELPSLWAITELKRLQHDNPARKWVPQDHHDLIALTMAVVHCDVIVFDKHWSDMARRAHLDARNATVLSNLRNLPRALIQGP